MRTNHAFHLANAAKITTGPDLQDGVWLRFAESSHGFLITMNKQQAGKLKDELSALDLVS